MSNEKYYFYSAVDNTGIDQFFIDIAANPLLSAEQEQILASRIAGGDMGARDELVDKNYRLVVSIAKNYVRYGVLLEDLIQEGSIGLMKAATKFQPGVGRFSTYATWWIKQTIVRAIDLTHAPVYIPIHAVEFMRRVNRVQSQMENETGQLPSYEELAERAKLSVEDVQYYLSLNFSVLSLDQASSPAFDESSSFGEMLEDPNAIDPYELINEQSEQQAMLRKAIARLDDPRERDVLCRRLGIAGYKEQTFNQVSEAHGVSRERIRQIETSALIKVKRIIRRWQQQEEKEQAIA